MNKYFKSLVKWSLILFFAIFFCLRIAAQIELGPDSPQLIIEDRINSKVCRAAKKYGRLTLGSQGALTDIMLDKMRGKTYYFDSKEEFNLEKGREYLVKLVLDILKIYNDEKLYRKYLFEYPFNTKNIKVSIFSKSGKAIDRNLPKITGVSFLLNHLHFEYLQKISSQPHGRIYYLDREYEEKEIKEGFRVALAKVKDTLSSAQLETANSLGLLDGNFNDEETSADREYRSEIDSKELWILRYEKRLRDGTISQYDFQTDTNHIKQSNSTQWEKDIVFPDEKSRALYQKKVQYLKGEKEWEN